MRFITSRKAFGLALALLLPGAAGAADIANGQRLYLAHCVACHGFEGQSPLPNVPNFIARESLFQPDFALMQTIRTGKGTMPPYIGILKDREIFDVIAYIRTLGR